MHPANAASAYARNAILTASPEKVVVMLYDRAIQQIERARIAVAATDPTEAGDAIGRAFAIVGELRNTRGPGPGPQAVELDRLYEFTLDQLAAGQQTQGVAPLDASLRVLRPLKEGFDGIAVGA